MPLEHTVALAVLVAVCVIESKLRFDVDDDSPLYKSVAFVVYLFSEIPPNRRSALAAPIRSVISASKRVWLMRRYWRIPATYCIEISAIVRPPLSRSLYDFNESLGRLHLAVKHSAAEEVVGVLAGYKL